MLRRPLYVVAALVARAAAGEFPVEDRTLANGVRVVTSWSKEGGVELRAFGGACAPCAATATDDLGARLDAIARKRDAPTLVVLAGAFDRAVLDEKLAAWPPKQAAALAAPVEIERVRSRAGARAQLTAEYRAAQPTPADVDGLVAAGALVAARLEKRLGVPVELALRAEPGAAVLSIAIPGAPWAARTALDEEIDRLPGEGAHVAAARARALYPPVRADALLFATLAFGNPRLARELGAGVASVTPGRGNLPRRRRVLIETTARRLPSEHEAPKVSGAEETP